MTNSTKFDDQAPPSSTTTQAPPCDPITAVKTWFGDSVTPELVRLQDPRIASPIKRYFAKVGNFSNFDVVTVPCGEGSGGLCAVAFLARDSSAFGEFERLNPIFEDTKSVVWGMLKFVWLRITGWRPPSQNFNGFLWIADGLVPVENVVPGLEIILPEPGKLVPTMTFDDLKWPPGFREIFMLQRIEGQLGSLLMKSQTGTCEPNLRAAAAFLAERDGYVHDSFRGGFFKYAQNQDEREPVTAVEMNQTVLDFLHYIAAHAGGIFPANRIKQWHVKSILSLLQARCAYEPTGERDGLLAYVNARIERRPGASVTTTQIHDDYLKYCKKNGLLAYPPMRVHESSA